MYIPLNIFIDFSLYFLFFFKSFIIPIRISSTTLFSLTIKDILKWNIYIFYGRKRVGKKKVIYKHSFLLEFF